jgi:hypothetical protein
MPTETPAFTANTSNPDLPVNTVETGSAFDSGKNPEPGMALCMSGGGYRRCGACTRRTSCVE